MTCPHRATQGPPIRCSVLLPFLLKPSKLRSTDPTMFQKTINRLEVQSDNIKSWAELHRFYHRYRKCHVEDGQVQTGVGGYVTKTLVRHWGTLRIASRHFKQDSSFEQFALSGINITEDTSDLNTIEQLSISRCPKDLK